MEMEELFKAMIKLQNIIVMNTTMINVLLALLVKKQRECVE